MVCKKFLSKSSVIRFFLYSICDAFESDYQFFAASIAYYTLMSVVPLFIFLFFFGMVIFQINFKDIIPVEILNSPLKPIFVQIEQILNDSGVVSGTATLIMLWFSRGVFLSLERSFCEILGTENRGGFFYRHVVILLAIFFLWILMFVFYVAKYTVVLLLPKFPLFSFLSSVLVPALVFSLLVGIYYFLLPVNVGFRFVVKVSAVVFLLLTAFEKFFVWFVLNVSKVSILYGSFAAIVIFLLWIYYSATVVLLGVGMVKAKLIMEGDCG